MQHYDYEKEEAYQYAMRCHYVAAPNWICSVREYAGGHRCGADAVRSDESDIGICQQHLTMAHAPTARVPAGGLHDSVSEHVEHCTLFMPYPDALCTVKCVDGTTCGAGSKMRSSGNCWAICDFHLRTEISLSEADLQRARDEGTRRALDNHTLPAYSALDAAYVQIAALREQLKDREDELTTLQETGVVPGKMRKFRLQRMDRSCYPPEQKLAYLNGRATPPIEIEVENGKRVYVFVTYGDMCIDNKDLPPNAVTIEVNRGVEVEAFELVPAEPLDFVYGRKE